MRRLLPIVEGPGDAAAAKVLILRIAADLGIYDLEVLRPHIRGDLPKVTSRFKDFLMAATFENAPILWIMDYDCSACIDVEADIARLQLEAEKIAPATPARFTFMVKEFESLFLTDEVTTRRVLKHIPAQMAFPVEPEDIRDAKGWLSKALPKGLAYKETTHQEKISAQLNLPVLRAKSPSFRRFEQALLELINTQS